jgi:hypothetical protein
VSAQDLERGLRNYQDIMGGRKAIGQLSDQERSEVLQVRRIMQAKRAKARKSAECENALAQARSAGSQLADYSRLLKNCAEAANFFDDCGAEFRKARISQRDYESAVSSVRNNCH